MGLGWWPSPSRSRSSNLSNPPQGFPDPNAKKRMSAPALDIIEPLDRPASRAVPAGRLLGHHADGETGVLRGKGVSWPQVSLGHLDQAEQAPRVREVVCLHSLDHWTISDPRHRVAPWLAEHRTPADAVPDAELPALELHKGGVAMLEGLGFLRPAPGERAQLAVADEANVQRQISRLSGGRADARRSSRPARPGGRGRYPLSPLGRRRSTITRARGRRRVPLTVYFCTNLVGTLLRTSNPPNRRTGHPHGQAPPQFSLVRTPAAARRRGRRGRRRRRPRGARGSGTRPGTRAVRRATPRPPRSARALGRRARGRARPRAGRGPAGAGSVQQPGLIPLVSFVAEDVLWSYAVRMVRRVSSRTSRAPQAFPRLRAV